MISLADSLSVFRVATGDYFFITLTTSFLKKDLLKVETHEKDIIINTFLKKW